MMRKITVILLMCLFFRQAVYAAVPGDSAMKANELGAMGAVLMDAETGRVLWGKNERTPLPMASTTKIMTAIVALENGDMNDIVTVSKRASAAPQVKLYLTAGEKIKLEYLLYALMLQSSNDAAVAVAEHVGGSVEDFCKTMTEKARELGANDTVFETPNGLDGENHHSTAYDMALITRYALQNPEFMKIINTREYSGGSDRREYTFINKNRLLNEFSGANGVKTGFTGRAGHCFVGAAKRGDMQLISVVLASGWGDRGKQQKWTDTKKLLSYGFDNYKYTGIIEKGAKAGDVLLERSKTDKVAGMYAVDCVSPLTKAEADSIYIDVELPQVMRAPVKHGQKLGVAKVYVGGSLFEEVDILSAAAAARHDLKTSAEKVIDGWLEMGTNEQVNVVLPEF